MLGRIALPVMPSSSPPGRTARKFRGEEPAQASVTMGGILRPQGAAASKAAAARRTIAS